VTDNIRNRDGGMNRWWNYQPRMTTLTTKKLPAVPYARISKMLELSACIDCALFVANGDLPENDDDAKRITDGATGWFNEGYHLATSDQDFGFSWQHCQVCKSHLGGDRQMVVAMSIVNPHNGRANNHLERDRKDVVNETSGS
jgi:hypothetical protein